MGAPFRKASMKGRLISFEGPDGSGKSTQLVLLKKALQREGYPLVVTREPGGTSLGLAIRKMLLDPKNVHLSHRAELFLYLADRAQHVQEVVLPALRRGKIVLVDRFMDSTWVYQGAARRFPLGMIEQCNDFAVCGIVPDLTLVFDVPARIGLSRVGGGRRDRDRMEAQAMAFHRRVCSGFRQLQKKFPARVVLLDGRESPESIAQKVRTLLRERLGL